LIRIDSDNYVVLYLQYEDHLHRYVVPIEWTVALLANRLIDSFDKDKPIQFRRKPSTEFKVFNEDGISIPLKAIVSGLVEGSTLTVKVE